MPAKNNLPRFGLHYFPDTIHYRDTDLNLWLPKINAVGASWLTLIAPMDRAIPEDFVVGLVSEGIQPVLHFYLPLRYPPLDGNLRILFEEYAKWGAKYIVLFDRPNLRTNWPAHNWARDNLVERFLDIFLPVATLAYNCGLVPVFPPLEPGGDFWDTSFLRASLKGMLRRGRVELAQDLVIGAYGWTGNRSLNWGAGGPECWSTSRPYMAVDGVEDQRGFRIFEWYITETQAITGKPPKIIILAGGSLPADVLDPRTGLSDTDAHAQRNLTLIKLLESPIEGMDVIPPEVLTCNFWLLSSGSDSPHNRNAWFHPSGQNLPIVHSLNDWNAADKHIIDNRNSQSKHVKNENHLVKFEHYLLLPSYEWGIADWHLEVIRPFVKKHRPTVGFSVDEATKAQKVTVIGDPSSYPSNVFNELFAAGCIVDLIEGDGTTIASKLASL
jgi:hypothetical protein